MLMILRPLTALGLRGSPRGSNLAARLCATMVSVSEDAAVFSLRLLDGLSINPRLLDGLSINPRLLDGLSINPRLVAMLSVEAARSMGAATVTAQRIMRGIKRRTFGLVRSASCKFPEVQLRSG